MATKKEQFLSFKGRPLIRSGNTIYYGDMTDPYIATLQIQGTESFQDLDMPSRVSIQLLSTDESLPILDRIVKNAERKSFYDAINIATIWLDRILEDGEVE